MITGILRAGAFRHSLKLVPFFTGMYVTKTQLIQNDSVAMKQPITINKTPQLDHSQSQLSQKLNYDDLCFGSISGLFLGIVVGRFSSVIVFLTLSAYLVVQFLENRGFITIPWNSVVNVGRKQIDMHTLFFKKPSFKVSFAASFLIAAFNV